MKRNANLYWVALMLVASLLLGACGGAATPTEAPPEPPAETEAPVAETTQEPAAEMTEEPVTEGELGPAKEIIIYHWSEYIDPEIYTMFEQEEGIRIVEDNFSNNEELLAKLQGGAAGYALIVPSDYTVSIMIEEGMLAELDHNNIPNLNNLALASESCPTIQATNTVSPTSGALPGSATCLPRSKSRPVGRRSSNLTQKFGLLRSLHHAG